MDIQIERIINFLQCPEEPLNLVGNWDTNEAQVLEIYFERCDNATRTTCVDETAFHEWVDNKYILIANNYQRFLSNEFGHDRFMRGSEVKW